MSNNSVVEIKNRDTITGALTEMLQTGAQQLIHQAVQAELAVFMELYSNQSTDDGRAPSAQRSTGSDQRGQSC